jgi:hypothetical protein
MDKQIVSWIMIVLGILIFLFGLGIEVIGLGDNDGIGWVQLLIAAVGVVMAIGGWDILRDTKKA